jgi:hypothetical protein
MKSGRVVPVIVIAGAVVVLLAVSLLAGGAAPAGSRETDARATTLSAAPLGTKALFLVLDHFMPGVGRLVRPTPSLAAPGGDAPTTLLVMQPTMPLGPGEESALDAWVSAGGQLIIATSVPWPVENDENKRDYLSRYGFKPGTPTAELVTYYGWKGSLVLDAAPMTPGGIQPLFTGPDGAVVAEKDIGEGRIVVITDGYAWSNARLARSQNAAWLISVAGSWGNGRMLVDEFHQGVQGGAGDLALIFTFLRTFWGIAVLQLAAAATLYALGRAWRFGPAQDLPPERIQDPLERIRGIASFLQATQAREFSSRAVAQLAAARRHTVKARAEKGAHV